MDSFSNNIYFIWYLVGVFFLIGELIFPRFVSFFFSIGAFLVSLILYFSIELSFTKQILLFFSSSLISLFALRSYVQRIFLGEKKEDRNPNLLKLSIMMSGGLLIFFLIFTNVSFKNISFKNEKLSTILRSERLNEAESKLAEKEDEIKQYNDTITRLEKEIASIEYNLEQEKIKSTNHRDELLGYIEKNEKLEKEVKSLKDRNNEFVVNNSKSLTSKLKDLTIEETDLDNFEKWDTPSPPPSSPEFKFIPYDEPPKPITPIKPVYPDIAQEAGIEGQVLVRCFINEKGRVTEAIVVKGIPRTGLNESAVEALKKTRFKPATQRKKPVGVWITIPINYKLQN